MTSAAFIVKNVLVPVVTLVLSYMVYSLDRSVKTFDRQLKDREAVRLEASDDREMRFKIYDAVTTSLGSADVKRQQVAQALVVSMLDADDVLRSGLLARGLSHAGGSRYRQSNGDRCARRIKAVCCAAARSPRRDGSNK